MRDTNRPFNSSFDEKVSITQQRRDNVHQRGTEKRPDPPRSLQYAAGSRCAQVTWSPPPISRDIAGYRIYVDTELTPYGEISDPSIHSFEVSCSTGVPPPPRNVFISSVNAAGFESRRVQIQVQSLTETGTSTPPPAPTPPPSSATKAESPDSDGYSRYYY